uniref:Uncharacterized protein n=1 Tax=Mesocestoides corti TaxID=53468 RepID=A0A5K3FV33_MESCO
MGNMMEVEVGIRADSDLTLHLVMTRTGYHAEPQRNAARLDSYSLVAASHPLRPTHHHHVSTRKMLSFVVTFNKCDLHRH